MNGLGQRDTAICHRLLLASARSYGPKIVA